MRGVFGIVFATALAGAVVAQTQPPQPPQPPQPAPPGTHEWLPSLPVAQVYANGVLRSGFPAANGGVVTAVNADSGVVLAAGQPRVVLSGSEATEKSVLDISGNRGGWKWGTVVPPAIMANYRSFEAPQAQFPQMFPLSNVRDWVRGPNGDPYVPNCQEHQGYHFPWGSKLNIDLMASFPTGDLLPLGPTIASAGDPMSPAGMEGVSSGWKGQTRPTLDGSVDLLTGRPIVRVTDLNLPFGSTSFNLNRTRSSIVQRGDTTTNDFQGVGSDRWWDWAGNGWMIGENPVLLLDCADPYLVSNSTPPTSWVILDAHRSLPFQQIEGVLDTNNQQRYEGLPRLGATMQVFDGEVQRVDIRTGMPITNEQALLPANRGYVRSTWTTEPRMAKVTLYNGALTYWFAIIPKTVPGDDRHATIGGVIPPMRWDPTYLDPNWTSTWAAVAPNDTTFDPVLFDPALFGSRFNSDATWRPFDPQFLRSRTTPGGGEPSPMHFWNHAHWGYKTHGALATSGVTPPGLSVGRPGLGTPRLGLLTKIEDRSGNEVHIEYVSTKTSRLDDPTTPDRVEFTQDGPAIGQIKAVHLVGPSTGVRSSGETPESGAPAKKLWWTLLYVHRATANTLPTIGRDFLQNGGGNTSYVPEDRVKRLRSLYRDGTEVSRSTMHGKRTIDRIWAYEGGLPRATLNELDVEQLTISPFDESGYLGKPAEIAALLARNEIKPWKHEVRYQYDLATVNTLANPVPAVDATDVPGDTPRVWVKHKWTSNHVAPEPVLAQTVIATRTVSSTAATSGEERVQQRSRVYMYSLAGKGAVQVGDEEANRLQVVDVGWRASNESPSQVEWYSAFRDNQRSFARSVWLDAILEQEDIDSLERSLKDNPIVLGQRQMWDAPIPSLRDIILWRQPGTQGTDFEPIAGRGGGSDRGEVLRRFASRRFDTWRNTGESIDAMVTPTREQLVRDLSGNGGTAPPAFVSLPGSAIAVRDYGPGAVSTASLKQNAKPVHYRIHRLRVPPTNGPAGTANLAPRDSAFLNPFWWQSFSAESEQDGLVGPPADVADGLTKPRFIVVIDAFASRNALMNIESAAMSNGEGESVDRHDNPFVTTPASGNGVQDDPSGQPNRFAILPNQLSRRVVELNAWGFVLRERTWEFDKAGELANTSSRGIGEDYVYRTVRQVFPDIAAMVEPPPSTDADTRDPRTVAFAKELLLVEKRTVGHSVAVNDNAGGEEGLIELFMHRRVDGGGAVSGSALDLAPWSSRVQQVATAISKGSVANWTGLAQSGQLPGNVRLVSQRFFKGPPTWSMAGEVKFLAPRASLLEELPRRPGTGTPPGTGAADSNPDFAAPNQAYSTTWTETEYYQADKDSVNTPNPVPVTAWRTIGERVVQQPRRTSPGGPWLFPFTASIDNGAGEKTITVTGLVANPDEAGAARGEDEKVVVTWQSQSQMPWATVVDIDPSASNQADVSTGPLDGQSGVFPAAVYASVIPESWQWKPNQGGATREPLALTTITQWSNYEPVDQWTQVRGLASDLSKRGELRRRAVRHVIARNVTQEPSPNAPGVLVDVDDPEDDRLIEFIFESLVPLQSSGDRAQAEYTTQSEGEVRVYAGGSKKSPVERSFKVTWRGIGSEPQVFRQKFDEASWPLTMSVRDHVDVIVGNEISAGSSALPGTLWTSGASLPRPGGGPAIAIAAYRKSLKRLALDSFGRPQKLEDLEPVSIGGNPPIFAVVGSKLVNDLGEVFREQELGGNITRQTRNSIGQVLRKYVGSVDGQWGLVKQDGSMGMPHDMTLREAYAYGTSPNDIYQRTHVWRYSRSPEWAAAAYYDDPDATPATTSPSAQPAQSTIQRMGAKAALTKTSYDWRGRAVRVDEYDFAGATVQSADGSGRRLRTTLTYLDHAGRTLMVATYGEHLPELASFDPVGFGIDGFGGAGADGSGQAPTPGQLLALPVRPISLVRYVLNTDGHAEETRTYDLMADGVSAGIEPPYQSEFRYVGFAGKEVFSASANGPVRRTQLDGLGRAEKVSSIVPGTTRELERTEYTYDPDGRVIVEKRFERVPSGASDAANELSASGAGANAVETQVWTWYDTTGRVLARADLGSNGATYSRGNAFGARTPIPAGPLLQDPTHPIVHEQDADATAGAGAKVTVNGYDRHGRLAQVREPNGKRTATYYVGETDRVARVLENFGETTDKQRETTYLYELRRLVRVQTGTPHILFGNPGSAEVFVEYGADVVDASYTRVSRDMTAIGKILDDARQSRPFGLASDGLFVNQIPKARLRYFLDGKLAERIDGRGVALRYAYDGLGRLVSTRVFTYATPWSPDAPNPAGSYGYTPGHLATASNEMVTDVTHTHTEDPTQGYVTSQMTVVSQTGSVLGDNKPSTTVSLWMDGNGRLVSDMQVHGAEVMSNETPYVGYQWERVNASGTLTGYTRLQRMVLDKLNFASSREFDYGYGSGDDDALSRLTSITTSIYQGTPRSVAEFAYAGVDRRITTVQGPHYNQTTFDSRWSVDTDPGAIGLEGLDRFGRQTDLHYANSNGTTHFRQQMGYDAGDQRLFSQVTQAPEPVLGSSGQSLDQDNTRSALYAYDLLGRLIKSEVGEFSPAQPNAPPGGPAGTITNRVRQDRWFMDAIGNWAGIGSNEGRISDGNLDLFGTPWEMNGADAGPEIVNIEDGVDRATRIESRAISGSGATTVGGARTDAYAYDLAGNLVYDGKYVYSYDAWSRLVAVSLDGGPVGGEETIEQYLPPATPRAAGMLVKHFAYDGLGRLIRTLSPFPNVETFVNSGQPPVYRSERFYYDGQRRIAEVVVDPVASIAAAIASEDEELLGIASIPGAIVGDTPDGKKKAVPLWFEGLQQSQLTEPPPAYISREYIWGPGDRGPDELLAMFAWDGVGGTGNVNNGTARPPNTLWSVITDASGDCVGLITEATLSQDAQVAWQATYEPYGTLIDSRSIVPHPHLKAGHKGLFAERLDGGVVTGMLGVDRGRLEPGATLLYHNRNRTFSPTLGRFLQSDPNASGLAVIGSVSYAGSRAMVDVMGADLSAMTGDGVGLYQYLGGNPIRGSDPTGLFSIIDILSGGGEMMDISSDYNEAVIEHGADAYGSASAMLNGAAAQQDMLVESATDWSVSDDMFTDMLMANRPRTLVAPAEQGYGGGLVPGRSVAAKWLPPVINPARMGKAAALYGRVHGSLQHMTKMWKHVKAIKAMIKKSGGTFQKQMMRHNQALVGPDGKVLSTIRPDVQVLDVTTRTLYVAESVVSSPMGKNRFREMLSEFRKRYPEWNIVQMVN